MFNAIPLHGDMRRRRRRRRREEGRAVDRIDRMIKYPVSRFFPQTKTAIYHHHHISN